LIHHFYWQQIRALGNFLLQMTRYTTLKGFIGFETNQNVSTFSLATIDSFEMWI